MAIKVISSQSEPLKEGESWWVAAPNNGNLELCIPENAHCICKKYWEDFQKNIVYPIVGNDPDNGYISLMAKDTVYKMPYYVFNRYFDAQPFLRHVRNKVSKRTVPQNLRFKG